jgi:hypothetical protein
MEAISSLKCRLTFTRLHGVTYQKIELFIRRSPLVPVLSNTGLVHALPLHFFKIQFNIIFPSAPVFHVACTVKKSSIFCDVTPCSSLVVNRRFGGSCHPLSSGSSRAVVATGCMLASCSAYSSTLNMEAICSSETSLDFQRTARRYNPEDGTIHNHRWENSKPSLKVFRP